MKEVVTEIEIAAPAEKVWQVLTDFAAFPVWNPFIRSVEGELAPGAQLRVRLQGFTFKPQVLKVEPNRELRWRGRILMPGIFDGEHYFILVPLAEDKTRLVQGERFTGLLVPVAKSLDKNTQRGFEDMNRALKSRAEQSSQESASEEPAPEGQ